MGGQEEEIRRAAEEKQRQEDEEAAKWMDKFEVVKEGDGERGVGGVNPD